MKSIFQLFAFGLLVAVAMGQESPEPQVDPFTPTLDVTTAGDNPVTVIKANAAGQVVKICPTSYLTGYSVRCNIETTSSVVWKIDGKLYKKEYFAPFFVAGNWDKQGSSTSRVRPFTLLGDKSIIISCKSRGQNEVSVTLMKSC